MDNLQIHGTANNDDVSSADTPDVPSCFVVVDDDSANWVIRKILEARAYARHCQDWCDREQSRARRDEEFFFFRFGKQLETFARQKIAELSGRRKSINFPAGTLGFRHEGAKLVIEDEAAVIEWAKIHLPKAVEVAERLSKSDLNHHLEMTGEVPNVGAHIEAPKDKFYIR